jgi:xanthine dehydrogenase accessory factor
MGLELVKAIAERTGGMALATILTVKGSSPRHAGTKLLLGAGSAPLGTVGGGQGENRALAACRRCLEDSRAMLLRVGMTGTDAQGPEMICGGSNVMLIEPVPDPAPYRLALDRMALGQRVLLVKRIQELAEDRCTVAVTVLGEDGALLHGPAYAHAPGPDPDASRALATGKAQFNEAAGLFYDPLFPEEKLLILGAGHVGRALAGMAPALGFSVTVVDDRPEYLAPGRFPGTVRAVLGDFSQAIAEFPFDAATYAVVVTRGHLLDLQCLRALLGRPYRYAGFMGSARKTRFLIDQVLADGHDPAKVASVCAPIGLDIGAETPEELAIAILGELVAVRRSAAMLAELQGGREARRA